MREIKFRAWIPDTGHDNEFPTRGHMFEFPLAIGTCHGRSQGETLGTVMQFTGLKDKNGKEIYEGDIVNQGGHDISEVFFRSGSFATYLDKDKYRWLEMSQNSFDFEIIGNIYENPDLIK